MVAGLAPGLGVALIIYTRVSRVRVGRGRRRALAWLNVPSAATRSFFTFFF
jgi:hypothetical protein